MNKQEQQHIRNLAWDLLIDAKISRLPIDIYAIAYLYNLERFIDYSKSLGDFAKIVQKNFSYEGRFGDTSDWAMSDIRRELNGNYYSKISEIVGKSNIIMEDRDLTSLDGLRDYGMTVDRISILSAAEYAKYRKIFDVSTNGYEWWLINPWSTPCNGYDTKVCCVSCSGTINGADCHRVLNVRPTFKLKSSVLAQVSN